MLDLRTTYASNDLQNFRTVCLGEQRRIKTRTTLLDGCKMKSGSVGDNLEVIASRRQVAVGNTWNIHKVHDLWKSIPKIRVAGTAIAQKPARVHRQVHQVRESLRSLIRARRLAAWQPPESLKI